MRIVWKKPFGIVLVCIAGGLIGSACILLFTHRQQLGSRLNVIGCLFLIVGTIYRMKFDPAYRDRSPFDGNKLLRLF